MTYNISDEYGLLLAAEQGKWFTLMTTDSPETDPAIKVRSVQSEAYEKAMTRLSLAHQDLISDGPMTEQKAEAMKKIGIEALGRAAIVDWKNITDAEGNPIPYTPEEGVKMMKALKPLRDQVQKWANDLAQFKAEADRD